MVDLQEHAGNKLIPLLEISSFVRTYFCWSHQLYRLGPLSSLCDCVIVVYSTVSIVRFLPEAWCPRMTVYAVHRGVWLFFYIRSRFQGALEKLKLTKLKPR